MGNDGYKERTGCRFFWGEREEIEARTSHGDGIKAEVSVEHECTRADEHSGVHICGICFKKYDRERTE